MERHSADDAPPLVLAGSSLGPESDSVVRMALAITRSANGRAVIVHVLEPRTDVARGLLDYPMVREGLVAAARERVAAQLRRVGATVHDVAELAIELPPVHTALMDAAERWKAALVVVGTNSNQRLSPRLGSSATKLLGRSLRPVWLVKGSASSLPSVVLAPLFPMALPSALADSLRVIERFVPADSTEVIPACVVEADEHHDGGAESVDDPSLLVDVPGVPLPRSGREHTLGTLISELRAELLVLARPVSGEEADRSGCARGVASLVRGATCSVLVVPQPRRA